MSASRRDLDRAYWSLVVLGPMTFSDLAAWTNWTRHRLNDALQRLKRAGCVELIERQQHRGRTSHNPITRRPTRMRCGKWRALRDCRLEDSPVIDAEVA